METGSIIIACVIGYLAFDLEALKEIWRERKIEVAEELKTFEGNCWN